MSQLPAKGPIKARTRGPVEIALEVSFGLFFVALFSWFIGIMIEVVGSYTLWKNQGSHAQKLVAEDLGYIKAAPRSLLIKDTQAWSRQIINWVELPYRKFGVLAWIERNKLPDALPTGQNSMAAGAAKATRLISKNLSQLAEMSMYVAQDVLLRLSIAAFALPAFVLACLVGVVDGLVRRDLRRWGGGRESSFIYHHAKKYTAWAMTGGFGLYLAWPLGGFNPAYMVLIFTVLVAFTLSTTVATLKKYL